MPEERDGWGTVLPSIIDLEAELLEREQTARSEASHVIDEAKAAAERLLAETRRELPRLEREARERLMLEIDSETDVGTDGEDTRLGRLEDLIKHNHDRAVEAMVARILPAGKNSGAAT